MSELDPQQQANLAAFINAFGSLAVAVFTYWVWRLQRDVNRLNTYANLRIGGVVAKIHQGNILHAEASIINTTRAPAVITEWSVVATNGGIRDEFTAAKPVFSQYFKVPKYIGGTGWLINQDLPVTALALEEAITNPKIIAGSKVTLTIKYLGGEKDITTITTEAILENV
ncbi:hypothetical protein QF022_001471 [Vogesella perlucida]|nr:hypothetical protein [Vogesella perlucida]